MFYYSLLKQWEYNITLVLPECHIKASIVLNFVWALNIIHTGNMQEFEEKQLFLVAHFSANSEQS